MVMLRVCTLVPFISLCSDDRVVENKHHRVHINGFELQALTLHQVQ